MANEKLLDLSTFQAGLKRYDDSLADVAKNDNYNDLNNNIFRKGVRQWDLDITTGTSYPDSSDNTTEWTIELTQDEVDIINEQADGHYSYIGGPLNYCTVRCTRDSRHQNIESIIKITRENTDIDDLQVGDVIRFTIDGQWSDYDDFWTGVDELHIGESVNAEIFNIHTGSTFSGWTVAGSYFAQDRITAKKVMADTIGDKDGTLAELRESVPFTWLDEYYSDESWFSFKTSTGHIVNFGYDELTVTYKNGVTVKFTGVVQQ